MSERSERLFEALSKIDEGKINEAAPTESKKQFHWKRWGALAAALVLVVGLGAGVLSGRLPWLRIGGNNAGSGHKNDSSTFMSYAGPVFPLTTAEGGGNLTAQREITYDFQDWMAGNFDPPYYGLPVTDSYTLTNPTGEDKDVTLLYPFVTSLYGLRRYSPTLTLNGAKLDTELLAGLYSNIGNGHSGGLHSMTDPDSWEEYRDLLSDGRYQAGALEDWPDLSGIPVTVYEITNSWVAEGTQGTNPTIHAVFSLDYGKTTLLSSGFYGGNFDREGGTMRQSFSAPTPPANDSSENQEFYEKERSEIHYLIVVGEPIGDLQLFGTYDGDPKSADYMEWNTEIGADLRQYDTDLESVLRTVAEEMLGGVHWASRSGVVDDEDRPDFELYFGLMKDCLLDTGVLSRTSEDSYDMYWLEDMTFELIKRVYYLTAQITIPAGGSVTVEARFLKEASFDFACTSTQDKDVYGYDMVTKLGTNLNFTAQAAVLEDYEQIEIVRQNFGFDLENGVSKVTLDPDQEHYYLEVKGRKIQSEK